MDVVNTAIVYGDIVSHTSITASRARKALAISDVTGSRAKIDCSNGQNMLLVSRSDLCDVRACQ